MSSLRDAENIISFALLVIACIVGYTFLQLSAVEIVIVAIVGIVIIVFADTFVIYVICSGSVWILYKIACPITRSLGFQGPLSEAVALVIAIVVTMLVASSYSYRK